MIGIGIGMARNASDLSVDRFRESVAVDVERDLAAVTFRDEVPLSMAHQALLVVLGPQGRTVRSDGSHHQDRGEKESLSKGS